MKKIILFLIILILNINISTVFSNNNTNNFSNYNYVQKIELIEKYLNNHKRKIELFADKYDVSNDKELNSNLNYINNIIKILWKLKSSNYNQKEKDKIFLEIYKNIKKTNNKLKILLKNKKESFDKNLSNKILSYSYLGNKLSKQLDKLIIKIAVFTKNKNFSSKKKKQILYYLRKLELYSNKLKSIKGNNYKNEKELKNYMLDILKSIKLEIIWIRKEFKK